MTRAVVILGAGASADFGVPTLAHIFKDRYARQYLQHRPDLREPLNNIFWHPRGHTLNTSEQSLTVEQMLTLLKDWENEEQIPEDLKPQNVSEFRRRIYVLIQRAVFEGKSSDARHLNPIIEICHHAFDHTTWASFNWDCIFESSFWYSRPRGNRTNPRLAIRVDNWRGGSTKHTFLKLHGGINWWLQDDRVTYLNFTGGGPLTEKWRQYDEEPAITISTHRPVILEPSYYKYEAAEYRQLYPQWEFFFNELITAYCVIIIGYSLPELDLNARSKILTGFQVNPGCRWLIVDQSEQTCGLYARLLGTERVAILQSSLAGFNNDIGSHLQLAFPDIDFSS